MELLLLPNEKLFEVCEFLDTETLASMVRTNWRINQLCSGILDKRKDRLLLELKYQAEGTWRKCRKHEYGVFLILVYIRPFVGDTEKFEIAQYSTYDEDFVVEYDEVLYPDMEYRGSGYSKVITADIKSLRELLKRLNNRGYKKIETDELSIEVVDNRFLIRNYPTKFKTRDINQLDLFELQKLAAQLKGNLSEFELNNMSTLKNIIIEELDNHGKLYKCE